MTSWKFCLLDVDHVMLNDTPVIRLFGVTEKGKSIVVFDNSFRPYFYVEPKETLSKNDISNLKEKLFALEKDGRTPDMVVEVKKKILGKEKMMYKVTCSVPGDLIEYRNQTRERTDVKNGYEHNIPFYRKYLISNDFKPTRWFSVEGKKYKSSFNADLSIAADRIRELKEFGIPKLKALSFNTEIVEEEGSDSIVMLSIKDNRGFQRVISTHNINLKHAEKVNSERDIILRFIHLVKERNPDVIFGYNTDRFDMTMINQKALEYGLGLILGRDNKHVNFKTKGRIPSAYIHGRLHLDVYDFVEHILSNNMQSDILTLDNVSKELIGETRTLITKREMETMWKTGQEIEKMADYCLKGSDLALRLGSHIMPLVFHFSRLVGITPFDCCRLTYSQLVEGLLLRKAHETGEVILNRPNIQEVQIRRQTEPYEGGYVYPPTKGVYDKISLFDFRSLYPSVIVTFNISPDTIDCEHESCKDNKSPESEHHFCKKNTGFIPMILKELIEKREKILDEIPKTKGLDLNDLQGRQFSMKTLANAFYGYFGYPSSRWYSRVCAKDTAGFGRKYIKQVLELAKESGFNVVYGDTDSLFIISNTKKQSKEFLKKINKTLPGSLEMEFKGLYKRGIFTESQTGAAAKKKYALLDEKDNLFVRGLETRRRDWSKIAKDTQERVLFAILRERSTKIALDIISETVKRLKEGKVNMNDLIIYTQLAKPLEKYEQIAPHVSVARKMQSRGADIKEGMTISYVVTKGSGSISERSEHIDDANDYDPEYYIEHQVIPAAMRVLSALDVNEEDLLKTSQQKNLSGFFSNKSKN